MRSSILFLTLKIYSATGGIEKVCRVAGKSLFELNEKSGTGLSIYSMYDHNEEIIEKYFPASVFSGFGANKIKFVTNSIKTGIRQDIVILSHINLLSIGFLIKLISPKTKIILIAHGIEVWKSFSPLKKMMLNKCDMILPVSEFTKQTMVALNNFDESKLLVHNNCLDPFLPEPESKTKDQNLLERYGFTIKNKILLTLTRISDKEQYKGYDHVLYSVKTLINLYPDVRYLIVGKYDALEKRRMDNIIAELGIKDYVVFAGFIPDEEIAAHFSLADVYVMPSKKEGFGIVFIEAMHYGVPVIAGNKDGSVDALASGSLGILVDPDNQEEITKAIEMMIEHKEKYIPDHQLLMQKFSYPVYKKKVEDLLKNIQNKA
jgi:phosphatidyl-myo-inositol dimannoside synthase